MGLSLGRYGVNLSYILVKWDKVCATMANGGLGIRKLTIFNKALLEKYYGVLGLRRHDIGEGW